MAPNILLFWDVVTDLSALVWLHLLVLLAESDSGFSGQLLLAPVGVLRVSLQVCLLEAIQNVYDFIQFGNKLSFSPSAPYHGCGSHLMVTIIVDCMELTGEPINEVCAGFQDRFQILKLNLVC